MTAPNWTAGSLHCAYGDGAVTFHPPHVWTYTRDDGTTVDFNCLGQGEPPVSRGTTMAHSDVPVPCCCQLHRCDCCQTHTAANGDSPSSEPRDLRCAACGQLVSEHNEAACPGRAS